MQCVAVLLFPLREPPLKFLFGVHSADIKFVRDELQRFISESFFGFQNEHSFRAKYIVQSSIRLSVTVSDDEIGPDEQPTSLNRS